MSDTIMVLTDREKVRARPGMYIGDNDKLGLSTIVREIIDNAIDEFPNYPDKSLPIEVTLHSDNSVTVRDYGRGISPYESKKNRGQIEERLAYTLIGAGGKFKENREANGNKFAGGLNGTGSAATNFMSEYFDVTIWRDGKIFHDRFENGGIPVIDLKNGKLPYKKQNPGQNETGTSITFKADATKMRTTHIDASALETYFNQMKYLHPEITFLYKNERDGDEEWTEYHSENGLLDYMSELTMEDDEQVPLLMNPFLVEGEATETVLDETYEMKATIAVAFSKDDTFAAEAFTNGTYNPAGGTHLKGFYSGLLRLIKHYYEEFKTELNSKYKKQRDLILKVNKANDLTNLFKVRDIMRTTYVIIDFKHVDPILTPQTKDMLASPEAKTAVDKIFYTQAMRYLDRNVAVVQTLIGYLIKRLYDKAKEDDNNVKLNKKDAKLAVSTKLAAARNIGKGKGAELILVEGDSAAGSLKSNRDSNFQAILPLRGKVLNVQKATLSKALSNNEISTIFAVLGAGFGNHYDESKLQYDKVIICTDADKDGAHISVLLQTLFLKYMTPLMLNGHVYRLDTPLFVNIMKGKASDVYTYNEAEQEAFLEKNRSKVLEVNRNKGLGELTKEQVIETILDPKTRRLSRIVINDEDGADEIAEVLMGTNVQGRKRLFVEGEKN